MSDALTHMEKLIGLMIHFKNGCVQLGLSTVKIDSNVC